MKLCERSSNIYHNWLTFWLGLSAQALGWHRPLFDFCSFLSSLLMFQVWEATIVTKLGTFSLLLQILCSLWRLRLTHTWWWSPRWISFWKLRQLNCSNSSFLTCLMRSLTALWSVRTAQLLLATSKRQRYTTPICRCTLSSAATSQMLKTGIVAVF